MAQQELVLVHEPSHDVDRTLAALCQVVAHDRIRVFDIGIEALAYLRSAADHAEAGIGVLPRLVIIDVGSSPERGLDILAEIRADPHVGLLPVVILAPAMGLPDPQAATALGANSLIRKSMEPGRLRDNLALLVRYWMFLNVPPPPVSLTA